MDISAEALEIARANAVRLQLDGECVFSSNILTVAPILRDCHPERGLSPSRGTPVPQAFRDFDFVVSNPPYVGFGEADKVQKSVRNFEPQVAVFAGEQGLNVIEPLIEQAHLL